MTPHIGAISASETSLCEPLREPLLVRLKPEASCRRELVKRRVDTVRQLSSIVVLGPWVFAVSDPPVVAAIVFHYDR